MAKKFYEIKLTTRDSVTGDATTKVFCYDNQPEAVKHFGFTEGHCYRNYTTRKEKHYRRKEGDTMVFLRTRQMK